MAEAHLRLMIDAKTESNAAVVLNRFLNNVPGDVQTLEPYHKGGYQAALTIAVRPDGWASQVLYLIALGQTFGRGWCLSGAILEELDMTTTDCCVSGVSFAHLTFLSAKEG